MPMDLHRLATLAAGPRLPRRTVRLRLTLLYGGLFLLSRAPLLALPYILVVHATPAVLFQGPNRSPGSMSGSLRGPAPSASERPPALSTSGGHGGGLSPSQLLAQARRLQAQADRQHAAELRQLLIQSGLALAGMAVVSIGLGWLVAVRERRPRPAIAPAEGEMSALQPPTKLARGRPLEKDKGHACTLDELPSPLHPTVRAHP